MSTLPGIGPDLSALCLGGNVFGWTADEKESHAVLDAFVAAGGTMVDTADVYSEWGPGHCGGESESVIGSWLASRGGRDRVVIATKVAKLSSRAGLSAANVTAAAEDSLRRLGTDYIDLYYAHEDDPAVPLEETLGAFDALVRAGKVRAIGASNFTPQRLRESVELSRREGLTPYVATQDWYNLVEREAYERDIAPVAQELGLASFPFFGLGAGFLTGKYRPGASVQSARRNRVEGYLDDARTPALLQALDTVAATHDTTVAAVALAWLRAQPTVTAPIASARTPEQLEAILPALELRLGEDELAALRSAW